MSTQNTLVPVKLIYVDGSGQQVIANLDFKGFDGVTEDDDPTVGQRTLHISPPAPSSTLFKIHIVGDSNTAGSNGDGNGHVGGWRHPFERALRVTRSDFDFVGSIVDSPELCAPGLWFHDGHAGYKIEDIETNYAAYAASPGVGTPDAIVDMLGTNNIAAGDSPATMMTKREALDAVIDGIFPVAQRVLFAVLPIVPGSTSSTNQAAWDANRVTYNALLEAYCATKGYLFADLTASFGQGNFQSDGIHLNVQGQSRQGQKAADFFNANVMRRNPSSPINRVFRQRDPWFALHCNGAGNGATVSGNTGLQPGAGSYIFALDFYPTTLDAGALHAIAQYGAYGSNNFWALYQQGNAVRLYWNNGSGTIFSMSDEIALTINTWHRIAFIVDAATLTAGLYVNGECVGIVQGLDAWNIPAGQFQLGDNASFSGTPGYYGRVHAYKPVTCPRPGSMAALLAAERDYRLGASFVDDGISGGYELNNNLAIGFYNQPSLVLAGTAAFVAGYPSGLPLRPWEMPAAIQSGV